MEAIQSYDMLLRLVLFQGMSSSDMSQVVGHTKFGFHKFPPGHPFITSGDPVDQLWFLLNGHIVSTALSDDGTYAVMEHLPGPYLIEPEHIFGLSQRFSHSYRTAESCSFITLDKAEVMKLSDEFLIFRLNLLNYISTQLQKCTHRAWQSRPQHLEQRIIRFFESHSLRPAGEKHFKIKMVRLADELNDTRLNISAALNSLQDKGLIVLRRGIIDIPALEKLLM